MLKELLVNGFSLFQEYILRYVFPKTRARVRYKSQLKTIVDGFHDCLHRDMSSGMYNLINDFQRAGEFESEPSRTIIDGNQEKASLLYDWYFNYKSGYDAVMIGNAADLFREFGFILSHTQKIFDGLSRRLDPGGLAKFKKISSGYPKFKQVYCTTLTDFDKLAKEAKKHMPEINPGYAACLPEI